MKTGPSSPVRGLRLAKGLQLAGAIWVFGWVAFFVLGALTRGWLDVDVVIAGWPIDISSATRVDYTLVRFLILAPGFLLAAGGYMLRKRLQAASRPGQDPRR